MPPRRTNVITRSGPVNDGTVKALSMFTMEEEAEESDNVAKAYRTTPEYV